MDLKTQRFRYGWALSAALGAALMLTACGGGDAASPPAADAPGGGINTPSSETFADPIAVPITETVPEPDTSPDPGSLPAPPPATDGAPSPSDPVPDSGSAAAFACTQVIGFSQTAHWYQGLAEGGGRSRGEALRGFQAVIDNDRWQLLWQAGAGVEDWSNPDFDGWNEPLVSPCAEMAGSPDRVLLTISGALGNAPNSEQVWADEIDRAVTTVTLRLPSVRQVILQPVVGGPGDGLCRTPDGQTVRASANHPVIDRAIAAVAQRPSVAVEVVVGFSPTLTDCAGYDDALGHLTDSGNDAIGRTIGNYYSDFP
jgi:hypothetical protein